MWSQSELTYQKEDDDDGWVTQVSVHPLCPCLHRSSGRPDTERTSQMKAALKVFSQIWCLVAFIRLVLSDRQE